MSERGSSLVRKLISFTFNPSKEEKIPLRNGRLLEFLGVDSEIQYKKEDNWIGVHNRKEIRELNGIHRARVAVREYWICLIPRYPIYLSVRTRTILAES